MASEYSMVRVDDLDPEPSAISGTQHVDLGAELGCTEMRPKVWYLSPGDAMSFHRQTEQEELYYVLDGPARMKIGHNEEIHDVPTGTAIRVHPDTPRQLLNDTEDDHAWLVVGAPPVEDDARPGEDAEDSSDYGS